MSVDTKNERVKAVRRALGLTQERMAAAIGMSRVAVAQMELAQVPVSDRHIKTLAAMFGVNEQWLRTGDGDMFTDRKEQLLYWSMDRKEQMMYSLEKQWDLSTSEARLLVDFIAAPPEQRRKFFAVIDALAQWRQ